MALVFPISGTFLAANFPVNITWDGYLYLMSGIKMFQPDFNVWYHWLREPLYPLIISLLLKISSDIRIIVYLQGFMIGLSTYLIYISIKKQFKSFNLIQNIILVSFSFYALIQVIFYASYILQQSLFIFVTSLHIYFIFNYTSTSKNLSLRNLLFFGVALVGIASLLSILLILPSLLSIAYVYKKLLQNNRFMLKRGLLLKTLALGLLPFMLWNLFKIYGSANLENKYKDSPWFFNSSISQNLIPAEVKIKYLPAGVFSTLGISSEVVLDKFNGSVAGEHILFTRPSDNCSVWYPGPTPYQEEVFSRFKTNCSNLTFIQKFQSFVNFQTIVLPLLNLTGLCLLLLNLRKGIFGLYLFPLSTQIPYWLGSFSGSRYGLPLIFIFPFVLCFFLMDSKFFQFRKI